MSVPDQSGFARHAELPTLRLYLGGAAEELRVVPVELSMLTIGRRPYNDLPLDDLTVSGEHALLRRRNGEFVIYDLNSRNGTLVNGLPIQHRVLADGDVIDIGIYRLRFEAPAPTGAAAPSNGGMAGVAAEGGATAAGEGADVPAAADHNATQPGGSQSPPEPGADGIDGRSPPIERRSGERRTSERRAGDRRVSGRRTSDCSDAARSRETSSADPARAVAGRGAGPQAESGGEPGFDAIPGVSPADDRLAADAVDADPGSRLASIEHLNGPQAGQRQSLDRTINRIGGAAAQVAVISRRKGGFFITHLEGLTFPQVNGELIGLNAHRLSDGDLIELAGAMLRFRLGS